MRWQKKAEHALKHGLPWRVIPSNWNAQGGGTKFAAAEDVALFAQHGLVPNVGIEPPKVGSNDGLGPL